MADTANTVYRDFETDGVPSSGRRKPKKREIRALLTGYEAIINAFTSDGGLIYSSKAALDADLAHGANSSAWVIGDATVGNNGVYRKNGASGAGSWTRVADLPFSFIIASDVGAGTANAIQATTSVPVSGSALIWMNIFEANTSSSVTVSFNGGSALTIRTNSGNNPAPGGLVGGMIVLGIVSGSVFRLVSDQASAAILAAAESAKVAAEAAQAEAESAAAGVSFRNVADRLALKALNTAVTTLAFLAEAGRAGIFAWTLGNFSSQVTADTTSAIYIKSDAIAATVGAWVRQAGWLVDGIDIAWTGGSAPAATALAAALGSKTVKGSGTITLSSTLSVPAGVKLFGANQSLTFTQGNGANLGELVSLGEGASLVECVLDGNRANNTDNSSFVTLRVGNSNDCLVERNTIKNCCGSAVAVNNGLRAKVIKNVLFNFHDYGVAAFGNNAEHAHLIDDNWMHTIGWAGIILQSSDKSKIVKNRIKGQIIGGRDGRLNVNSSGTTVTWVSGPTFTGVVPGSFVVLNNGAEFRIASVDSSTQLTVETTLPTLSNTPATVGSGDLIGVVASSFCNISKNTLDRTSTFLFGFSLGGGAQCGNNSFVDNILSYAGKNAINLSGVGTGLVDNNTVAENKILNAGYGAGISTNDAIAIFIEGVIAGKVENTLIENNTVLSFAGSGQTTYWFGTDGNMSFGSVQVKGNKSEAVVNKSAIFNDILSITLSADWGSTASTGSITSNGEQAQFNITCAGTGFASNPNFTVNKVCDTPNDPPIVSAKIVANAGGALLNNMWGEQTSLRGQWKAFMAATPAAGHIYTMQVKS